jgi:hypothetical protein
MQANVSTATTVQPLPPLARHPRTPVAEFVAAHMPDAGPCAGADVTPAWLDAKLEELARRLTASHRGAPALTSALAAIGGARGELAAARVDWGQVEARLRQVASTIVRVQNPRTPVATPAYARELARDLGVQIGDTAIAALPTIIAAIRATDCGDRRAVLLMGEFIELITPLHEHHEGAGRDQSSHRASPRARRLRHAEGAPR